MAVPCRRKLLQMQRPQGRGACRNLRLQLP